MSKCSFIFLAVCLACAAAFGDGAHPKYTLGKKASGATERNEVFSDASYWKDEAGNFGEAGVALDPTGDYYTSNYECGTPATLRLDVHSLHLGEVGGDSAKFNNVAANYNNVLGVLNEGLFLNRGYMAITWLPFEICDTVTVQSPVSAPFQIYTVYGYPESHANAPRMYGTLSATLKSEFGKQLDIFHLGSSNPATSSNTVYRFDFTGDYSRFYGALRFGRDIETAGHVTKARFLNGAFPGTLKLTKSAILSISNDLEVANLTLSDGASIETLGGALVVTGTVTQAGAVNVRWTGAIPNVEFPEISLLTVALGEAVDKSQFAVTNDAAVSVSTDWRNNGNGTKTLVATFTRPSIYASPTGDDEAVGDLEHPIKTLSNAVARVTNGIIYALPGTYDSGECDLAADTHSRVHLPANVMLKSTDGAESTFIVGALGTSPGEGKETTDPWEGATRCVKMDAGAVIQGFTLTGGGVYLHHDDVTANYEESTGGGVRAAAGSVVADCRIYGNTAYRGGGGRGGAYVRCIFGTNVAVCADWAGPDLNGISYYAPIPTVAFDSVFTSAKNAYNHGNRATFYNCTFPNTQQCGPSDACKLYNCLIRVKKNLPGGSDQYYNCVLASQPLSFTTGSMTDCIVTNLDDAIDSEWRLTDDSPAIDFGDRAAYLAGLAAAGVPSAISGVDYWGTQRVYNVRIDAGATEYDWRGAYGRAIGRRVGVTEATPDVSLADGNVVLKGGDELSLDFMHGGHGGSAECTLTGDGVLYVWLGETLLGELAQSGVVDFDSAEASDSIRFVYASDSDDSSARVKIRSGRGFLLLFR